MYGWADLLVHRLLDEGGVEVARVECDEPDRGLALRFFSGSGLFFSA